jgi:hypothetical protein
MPGSVTFEYDEARNIVFVEDDWDVKTRQDVDEFFGFFYDYFGKHPRTVYMLAHIDKLLVHAEIADYYAEKARDITHNYLLGFARWGTDNWARMTVRTTSSKANMAPRIYATREEGIAAIEAEKRAAANRA